MRLLDKLKAKARDLKKELKALYLVYKRPDTPWYAKVVIVIVVGYALSPIDLIPDFIPVLGYIDDLILIPLGILIVIRLIPDEIMDECRLYTEKISKEDIKRNWVAACIIIVIWILVFYKIICSAI